MRETFVVFFAIVFAIYFSVQAFLFWMGWRALEWRKGWRGRYAVVFWFLALSFLVGRYLESVAVMRVATAFLWVGAFWLAVMYYLFLGSVVVGIGMLALGWMGWLPRRWLSDRARMRFWVGVVLVASVCGLVAWGHWNAGHPRVVRMEMDLPSKVGGGEVRIVVASDLHLGTLVTRVNVQRWVDTINGLKPDVIVFVGDVLDGDVTPVIEWDLGKLLRELKAPVYAVTGNHEYIGGVERAVEYLEKNGVQMLRDRAEAVAGGRFWLVGREDASIRRFGGGERAALGDLMRWIPKGAPVIVLDHQPVALREAAAAGAVLQLSGHTHDGQLWPNKFIVRSIFGLASGSGELEGMKYYVSPGLGTWGPPVRVGNTPEILELVLRFNKGS